MTNHTPDEERDLRIKIHAITIDMCKEYATTEDPWIEKNIELLDKIMLLVSAHIKQKEREADRLARIDELQGFYTGRHYGKDYQDSLDELDEYRDKRLAELQQPADTKAEE